MHRILAILVLTCLPVFAQQESLHVRTLALGNRELPPLWVISGSKPVKLEFSNIQPSVSYEVRRSKPFPIFLQDPGTKEVLPGVPRAMLELPNQPHVLLLGWMQGDTPKFKPVADLPPSGKFNEWSIINTTASEIAIQIGTSAKPVQFAAGFSGPLRVESAAGKGTTVVMAAKAGETWQKFFSSYWPVQEDQRCLILIVQSGDHIEAKQIFEGLERSTEPAKPE